MVRRRFCLFYSRLEEMSGNILTRATLTHPTRIVGGLVFVDFEPQPKNEGFTEFLVKGRSSSTLAALAFSGLRLACLSSKGGLPLMELWRPVVVVDPTSWATEVENASFLLQGVRLRKGCNRDATSCWLVDWNYPNPRTSSPRNRNILNMRMWGHPVHEAHNIQARATLHQ